MWSHHLIPYRSIPHVLLTLLLVISTQVLFGRDNIKLVRLLMQSNLAQFHRSFFMFTRTKSWCRSHFCASLQLRTTWSQQYSNVYRNITPELRFSIYHWECAEYISRSPLGTKSHIPPTCIAIYKKPSLCFHWRTRWWDIQLFHEELCLLGKELSDCAKLSWWCTGNPSYHPQNLSTAFGGGSLHLFGCCNSCSCRTCPR